jgi:lipoprotein-anchoring transpeptidase ErfK/SrfK
LACLFGLPIGQAVAQTQTLYPQRAVGSYQNAVPGYYVRAPSGYYYRVPPGYYVVPREAIAPRPRVYLYNGYPARTYYAYPNYAYPYARRYVPVAPGPSYGNNAAVARPQYQGAEAGPTMQDERAVAPVEPRGPSRQAVEPSLEPDPRGPYLFGFRPQPQLQPEPPARYAALPPARDSVRAQRSGLPGRLRRQVVEYATREPAGTIVIDTPNTYLYYVNGDGTAVRYGIGVGRDGFTWSGREKVSRMAEWPDWYPPKEMLERQPNLPRMMAGGPTNPLGARALYLGNTLYRIHGTNEPGTIGQFVSSGCIRLLNEDIEDLYNRVKVGTRVVVLPGGRRTARSATTRR